MIKELFQCVGKLEGLVASQINDICAGLGVAPGIVYDGLLIFFVAWAAFSMFGRCQPEAKIGSGTGQEPDGKTVID